MPSRLDEILWWNTARDVRFRITTKYGERSASLHQVYEALVLVANAALGGKPKKQPAAAPQTAEELEAVVNSIFG